MGLLSRGSARRAVTGRRFTALHAQPSTSSTDSQGRRQIDVKKHATITTALALLATCLAIVIAFLAHHYASRSVEWKRKAIACDERCNLLGVALDSQRLALETSAHREEVFRRMRDELPHWRPNALRMCTGNTGDLRRRSDCMV